MKKLQWGLLATGGIAKAFAEGVRHSRLGTLAAVGSRSAEQARAFASKFEIPKAYGSYEALLADPKVEAVYISTPSGSSRRRKRANTFSAKNPWR